MMVTGEAGSGKSLLADCVLAAFGAAAHIPLNDATEASLRQSFSGGSRALVLDESEHEEGGGQVTKTIGLIRRMSSGAGARIMRGSAGGKAQGFSLTGCVYLSSILHSPLKPQDRSRITLLRLLPHHADPDNAESVRLAIRNIEKLAPFFWRRAIDNFELFESSFSKYRAAFIAKSLDSRAADQIATLLAGRDILLYDAPPDSDFIEEQIEKAAHLVTEAQEQSEEGEGQQCLNHLYSSTLDIWRHGERKSIAQGILSVVDSKDLSERKKLEGIGLKLFGLKISEETGLAIANRHAGLDKIFAGTRWEKGAWRQALRYLPGAEGTAPLRFGGVQTRAIKIPEALLPAEDKAVQP